MWGIMWATVVKARPAKKKRQRKKNRRAAERKAMGRLANTPVYKSVDPLMSKETWL